MQIAKGWCRPIHTRTFLSEVALTLVGVFVFSGCGQVSNTDRVILPASVIEAANDQYSLVAIPDEANPGKWLFEAKPRPTSSVSPSLFAWDFGDGSTLEGTAVSHTFPGPGIYTITLTAFDSQDRVIFTLSLDMEIAAFNRTPEVDAGGNQTVYAGNHVLLDGSASIDADGDVLSFSWEQVSGTQVELTDYDQAIASFVSPLVDQDVRLVFVLTVSDGQYSAEQTVTVDVLGMIDPAELELVAYAGEDQLINGGHEVTLDARGSSGPETARLSFEWTQLSGPEVVLTNANEAVASFVAPAGADSSIYLTFELIVSDGELVAVDEITITVAPAGEIVPVPCTSDRECVDVLYCNGTEVCESGHCAAGSDPCPGQLCDNQTATCFPEVRFALENTEGQRPLTVLATAVTLRGEPLPEGTYRWFIDAVEANEGPVANHVLTNGGVHSVALAFTLLGSTVTIACRSVDTDGSTESAYVWPVISGKVRDESGQGISGATVSANADGTTAVTDVNGDFTVHVPYEWSGVVTAQHASYDVTPSNMTYAEVREDLGEQHFTAVPNGDNPPPPPPPACTDAECNDGVFCNGVERCANGACVAGSDPCPGKLCDEDLDVCNPVCTVDGDCDDGLFCTGLEVCSDGSCVAGSAPCSGLMCNESTNACVDCLGHADCNDDLFCNGFETCLAGVCQAGVDPCPGNECNETADVCVECLVDAHCDDGVFCNGAETCSGNSCAAGADPCPDQLCTESDHTCVDCLVDADCADVLFCNGAEVCSDGVCVAGADPCPTLVCDEAQNTCVGCLLDGDCDDSLFCNGVETCDSGVCQPGTNACPQQCDEGNDACVECLVNLHCDDGVFCNGAESCAAGSCIAGTAPCAGHLCDETSAVCVDCFVDQDCDDGDFCNGDEVCDSGLCQVGLDPCPGQLCDETDNRCVDCLIDTDCDDDAYCTGVERCVNGACDAGSDPCPVDQYCDEFLDACVHCLNDPHCSDDVFCNGAEICAAGSCIAGSNPCPGQFCDEAGDVCVDCFIDEDCDDDLYCNGLETCSGGLCQAGIDPCPAQQCDEGADECISSGAVIIDHTAVQAFTQIPDYWIGEVKKMLINYVGESHGRGLPYGMQLLAAQDSRFAAEVMWTGAPEAPTDEHLGILMTRWTGASWYPFGGEEDTWTHQDAIDGLNNHFSYSATQPNTVDAFAFAWCWDMVTGGCDASGWAGRAYTDFAQTVYTSPWDISTTSPNLNDYLSAWDGYAQNHPNIAMLYTTAPADGGARCEDYQRWLKNTAIRNWVESSTDRYLFDYADILSHNAAGELHTVTWDGHVFPSLHPDNQGDYDGGQGGCHINQDGCLRLAKAMWSLLAIRAGWDGVSQVGECLSDSDCTDGLFCNGQEICAGDICVPGAPPCSGLHCDEASDHCVSADCTTSLAAWQNIPIPSQSGLFTVEYDAVPSEPDIDGLTALSAGETDAYADAAVLVRFTTTGVIDARNGSAYEADSPVSYTPGVTYHFHLTIDIPTHTYSIYVTPDGSSQQTIGTGYAFRTEQSAVTLLDHLSIQAGSGSHTVCNFLAGPGGNLPPTVDAGDDHLLVLPANTLSLDATVHDDGLPDPPGAVTTTWSLLSGPEAVAFHQSSSVDTLVTFAMPGTYELELTAEDGASVSSDTAIVYVAPELAINASPTSGELPLSVEFTAMEGGVPPSSLPLGSTLQWDFGDDTAMASGVQLSHTYTAVGTYIVTLAMAMPGQAPVLYATKTIEVTSPSDAVLLVLPDDILNAAGEVGGPFEPHAITYTLRNIGAQPLAWVVSHSESWVGIDTQAGVLDPSQSTTVSVSIGPDAATLPLGAYTDTLAFTNGTSGRGDTTRSIVLNVQPAGVYANSVSQHGITWTFNGDYRVGQFVNGDWWVCPASPGAAVTVLSVNPAPTQIAGSYRNGSMANPMPALSQAYDARIPYFQSALATSFPYSMGASTSLVSTISCPEGQAGVPQLEVAAVLTCLAAPPPATAFRPPYCGSQKPIHDASQLRTHLLPSLQPVASTPTLAVTEAQFERMWLDHLTNWTGRYMHPRQNMPDYGRELSQTVGDGALMLLLDSDVIGDKTLLLTRFVQLGIDMYGIASSGGYWPCDGGHASGRKWPILFAGLMLDDDAMYSVGSRTKTLTAWRFGEDDQTFYVTGSGVSDGASDGVGTADRIYEYQQSGTAQSGTPNTIQLDADQWARDSYSFLNHAIRIVSGTGSGQTRIVNDREQWLSSHILGVTPDWTVVPDSTSVYEIVDEPLDLVQIGQPEYGIRHYEVPSMDNHIFSQSVYRICCTGNAWVGFVLAARIMNQQDAWNHDALFDYQDRYMEVTAAEYPGWRSWSRFSEEMWDAYRSQY